MKNRKRSPLGIVAMVLFAVFGVACLFAIIYPVFASARVASTKTMCLSNLKQANTCVMMYMGDWEDRLPDRDHWMDASMSYAKDRSIFRCSMIGKVSDQEYGFAFNSKLSRQDAMLIESPQETPVAYDSLNLAWNASDPCLSLPPLGEPPRYHRHGAFADGHARPIRDNDPLTKAR
jgi:hypothetical protein